MGRKKKEDIQSGFFLGSNGSVVSELCRLRRKKRPPRARIAMLEKSISSCPVYSILYAMSINEPFPAGEKAMSGNPWTSFVYATTVLHARFHAGEDSLCNPVRINDPLIAAVREKYIHFLQERDPITALAEDAKYGCFPTLIKEIRKKRKAMNNDS